METIFRNGLKAAKKNLVPGLLLQGFALLLVLLYYFHPPTQQILLTIPQIKERMGTMFPILVTALCGGLLPFLFLVWQKAIPKGLMLSNLLFLLIFWAFNGVLVDLLYEVQARLFGNQPNISVVIKKVCFDQFVFSAFIAAPLAVISMKWKQFDFSFSAVGSWITWRSFSRELLTVLISLWAVWIPTVAIVYSLPLALQFPLFNIVLCFWSLLLTALTHNQEHEHAERERKSEVIA